MPKKKITIEDLAQITKKGFEQVNKRFEQVDKRFDKVYRRFEQTDERMENMDDKFTKKFDKILTVVDEVAKNMKDFQIELASNQRAHDRFQKNDENFDKRLIGLEVKQGIKTKK